MEDELFHAGGQTDGRKDMTKLTVELRNFANAPKNQSSIRSKRAEIFAPSKGQKLILSTPPPIASYPLGTRWIFPQV
jgi:hypothetical protein